MEPFPSTDFDFVTRQNYFSDKLIHNIGLFLRVQRASKDLRILQLDKNLIHGRSGFKSWKYGRSQNRLEELSFGSEFFGNPMLADRGTAQACDPLASSYTPDPDEDALEEKFE